MPKAELAACDMLRAKVQELAARLLRKRHTKRDWAAGFDAFWASLPPVGSVYAKENWLPEHTAALQDPKLVRSLQSVDSVNCGRDVLFHF